MDQNYEKWGEMAKKLQEPFQALTDLNLRTVQSMHYLKPDDLIKVKRPEDLLEQQMELAIENGHKALDYMQESFRIIEKAMLSVLSDAKQAAQKTAEKVSQPLKTK